MSRARVAALALVNWKGVFYERYLLDRHVTALEGANGAGKTTVMIAAYVVLLPDMSRLRFTNLGESGATGGDRGIWGRLGEVGRPSYAVLDLEVGDHERVIAGIRLVRTTPPTVEPTAFLITGLAPTVRLSDLLLVRQLDGDHVPELDEISKAVAIAGGTIEVFKTTRDYFAALFERGITPMRLASEEERGKLNEMLRTSMTGGISRALTSELRSFLLKEETGLGDTLSRMRANLEACRRTRSEVAESRQLEREISAIYEAGLAMFGAAVHATRSAATEAAQRVHAAETAIEDAGRAGQALADELAALSVREHELGVRLAAARRGLGDAAAERDRRASIAAIQARLVELDRELSGLVDEADAARSRQTVATAERTRARQERTRAVEAYDRAAHGLAHLQEGLDELIRRAHGHRQLHRRLDDARALLDRPALVADDAITVLAELDGERSRCHAERARLDRDTRNLDGRRTDHAQALQALATLEATTENEAPAAGDPHTRARACLARFADLEAALGRTHELERELLEAERQAARQQAARGLAASLGLGSGQSGAAAAVVRALAEVDGELRAAEDEARAETAATTTIRHQLVDLRGAHTQLDDRLARWEVTTAAAARLATDGPPPSTLAEVAALRDRFSEEHHAIARNRAQLEANREELQRRAATLEQSGSAVDPELLRLRDELGGELLASRFEDVEAGVAAWVEARLGPLGNALIVEDPEAAAQLLADSERTLSTIWLVRSGSDLDLEPPEDASTLRDVISPEPFGLRVTRRAVNPSLGRRARERQVVALHAMIARDGEALDQLAERAQRVAGWRRDAELCAAHGDLLAGGDPSRARSELDSEIARLELAEHVARDRAAAAQHRSTVARTRLDGLRRLLGESSLLEELDHAARACELATHRATLVTARDELARVAVARRVLGPLVDVLREPPPTDAMLADAALRTSALDDQLDRLFHARVALEDVVAHRHAAAWDDAEAALHAQAQLAPALERQHADARAAVHAADEAGAATETAWETATAAAQVIEARLAAASAHRDRAAGELAVLATDLVISSEEEHERTLAAAAAAVDAVDAEVRALVSNQALTVERRERAGRAADEARARLAAEVRGNGPVATAWSQLRAAAEAADLLHAVLSGHAHAGRSSVQLTADAWSKRELLVDRIARARGGEELLAAIRDLPLAGLGYLETWQASREWLRRRVPAQVAEVADPLIALERLRDHLDLLDGRLARQEGDLRGASEDVARGIDVQVRRAHGQVRRLNQQLEGIKFGSIHGIRVEIRRVERMEQILRALRQGEGQELLFLSSMPIEEALDEIFRRYGGGGRSGGQRLLDYREYVELVVEIRRQTSESWESASPTRLSTGEAIGVGAALMMVVLTEWERDANLLRAQRTSGSLRFLFLDEANRLSRDNLGVLFDLCKNLDLQLLIAAPEVARAEGNTTYRLVRHVAESGAEEVIVSGRRAAARDADGVSDPVATSVD